MPKHHEPMEEIPSLPCEICGDPMSKTPDEERLSSATLKAIAARPDISLTPYGVYQTTEKSIELMEKGWNKDEMAINSFGLPTMLYSKHACSWCASGAVMRSLLDLGMRNTIARTQEYVSLWWDVNPDVIEPLSIPQAIKNRLKDGAGNSMVYYNDDPEVTLEDVIGTFRNMIRRPP